MNEPPQNKDSEKEQAAEALLALLYPGSEADGDAGDTGVGSGSAESEGSSSSPLVSDAELGEMKGVLSLFRDMPEEEPSEAITNKLLAMASLEAPPSKAALMPSRNRGVFAWLSDILIPLMGHPGLAAAAALVLVVGVAGTLYLKGGVKLATPRIASRATAPTAPRSASLPAAALLETAAKENSAGAFSGLGARASSAAASASEVAGAASEDFEAKAAGATETAQEEAQAVVSRRALPPSELATKNLRRDRASGTALQRAKSSESEKQATSRQATSRPPFYKKSDRRSQRRVTGIVELPARKRSSSAAPSRKRMLEKPSGEFVGGMLAEEPPTQAKARSRSADEDSQPAPASSPKPAKRASSPGAKRGVRDSSGSAHTKAEKSSQTKRSRSEPGALYKRAQILAARGDCGPAVALAKKIRTLDRAYYQRVVLANTSLKACLNVSK